jgi:sulfur-oxidizing protein SoxY
MRASVLSRRQAVTVLGALSCAPTFAAVGGLPSALHTDTSPEWLLLRERLFGNKPINADPSTSAVQLFVPLRAAYGASVPVKISSKLPQKSDLYVRKLHVLVDKNPSPLAAVLTLTPEIGQADFETRLRVDEYSHVRVVSELSNGSLHMDSRYVKTSGGCSAPPNRTAPHLVGKTVLKLAGPLVLNQPNAADVTVIHPNDSGFELNQNTVMYIPPHFIRSISVSFAQRKVFDVEEDFSVSENPTWRFHFVPRDGGEMRAEVMDSKDNAFVGSLMVA